MIYCGSYCILLGAQAPVTGLIAGIGLRLGGRYPTSLLAAPMGGAGWPWDRGVQCHAASGSRVDPGSPSTTIWRA